MSKPYPYWWRYAQGMIRLYPERAAALGDLHAPGLTARYGAAPGGGESGRTTEAVALRQLPPAEQAEYDAVRRALEWAAAQPDGKLRLRMVRMVYWGRRYRLYAAAGKVGVSYPTAKRWNGQIIRRVAVNRGILDEDREISDKNRETLDAIRRLLDES